MAEQTVAYGSNLQALYAVEDSWGELPSSPTVYNLRTTGFGINMERDSFTSEEIRSDRMTADQRQGMDNVSGDIPVELSYGAFDDLISSAMFNDWASDDTIIIGTTKKSLRIARGFPSVSQYHEFPGCIVNTWSVSVQPNAIITSTFNFLGQTMVTYSGAGAMGVDYTPTDKATNSPFDSFSGALYEGGTSSGDEIAVVTGIDFSLENALEPMQVIGERQSVGVVPGRASVSGTLNAYFVDSTMIDKFLNETESSLQIVLTDDSANSYQVYMPRIKYSGSSVEVSGEGPVSLSMPFTAILPTTGTVQNVLQISKL